LPNERHVSAVSWIVGILVSAAAHAGDMCPAPPKHAPASASDPTDHLIHIESDAAEASLGPGGQAVLNGGVTVRQDQRSVSADSVIVDRDSGHIGVKGSVDFEDPRLRVRSGSGSYDQVGTADFTDADFQLLDRSGRGTAREIALQPGGRIALDQVRYTTCPVGDNDWMLQASSINLDTVRQQGVARHVHLEFKGVPILYAPYFSFPLGDERKSGFLFPIIGTSSTNGIEIGIPYYVNLAPNYDLTLTPEALSKRGVELGGDFRFLTSSSHGDVNATYLPDDAQTHFDRSYFHMNDVTDIIPGLRAQADLTAVSDSQYFEDFAVGSEATSVTFLDRHADLLYYDNSWQIRAQLQNFQTIDISVPAEDRPYSRVPRVDAQGLWPLADTGLEFSLASEAVNFLREVGPTGLRFDVSPELRWSLRSAGWFFIPAVGFHFTQYDLQNPGLGEPATPTRDVPYGRLDTGLVFERDSGADGQRTETLEPRMVYSYVPYRDQDKLPIFDTALPDLNLTELFRTNRYVGDDRIGDADQLSLGVTSRLFDTATGQQFLAATIGQIRYFSVPRVTVPGEPPEVYNASDIVGDVSLTAYKHVTVNLYYQWNPYIDQSEKSEVSVQYRPDDTRMVNIGYRYQHDVQEQWDGSFAWPIAGHWNAVGRLVYSIMDKQTIQQVAGFEYRSCCWAVQFVERRYVTNTGTLNTSIALQFELLGLSSVQKPGSSFLQRSISGYSAFDQAP